MANLETLELQINGSASAASEGIDRIIGSLSRLSSAITKPLADLTSLRRELQAIASIKLPNFSGAFGTGMQQQANGMQKAASAMKSAVNAMRLPAGAGWKQVQDPATVLNASKGLANHLINNASQAELLQMKINGRTDAMIKGMANGGIRDDRLATHVEQIRKLQDMQSKIGKTGTITETGKEAEKATPKFEKFGKSLDRIGRMFSTLLIRSALKYFIKSFKESFQAVYEFSKANDGVFASSVERMKGLLQGATTNIVTAFAPAINALVPIVNVLAGAIQYLCNMISWLFSLLGSSGEFLGASTDAINSYTKAASGGGSATKEMLASFDELNVISSTGGGGGGGGSGVTAGSGLVDAVSDDMAKLQMIVGESLLAVGLILACCGHIPLGVAVMAVGAAAIAKTIINDWGKLSDQVKGEIATITAIVGVSALAIGAILAFSGANIPLGIGLMVIGAANLAATAYVSWGNALPSEVQSTITQILGIVGGALLAIGAILALSSANVPLGIGLMVAGAASLGAAATMNWGAISVFIKSNLNSIMLIVGGASLAVGAILALSGVNIPLGIALMAAGGIALASAAGLNWDSVKEKVTKVFNDIKDSLVKSWETVTEAVGKAWDAVAKWWDSTVMPGINAVWNVVSNWFVNSVWNPISKAATDAWNTVANWWSSTIAPEISRVWSTISGWFSETVWKPIQSAALNAWNTAKNWWTENVWTNIKGKWDAVSGWFSENVWSPIQSWAYNAWNTARNWWKENFASKVKEAWAGVQKFFTDMWEAITAPLRTLWSYIEKIFGSNSKTANYTINVTTNETTKKTTVTTTSGKKIETPTAGSIISNINNPFQQLGNFVSSAATTIGSLLGIGKADGAFGIDRGDLFIANEAGAELIGSINGKTSVANQSQIIAGISDGVERANEQQNRLLREQNELLRGILEKETSFSIGATPTLGKTVRKALDMYAQAGGY